MTGSWFEAKRFLVQDRGAQARSRLIPRYHLFVQPFLHWDVLFYGAVLVFFASREQWLLAGPGIRAANGQPALGTGAVFRIDLFLGPSSARYWKVCFSVWCP